MPHYSFPKQYLTVIMLHIDGLNMNLESMIGTEELYTMSTDVPFDEDQFEHLTPFGLELLAE